MADLDGPPDSGFMCPTCEIWAAEPWEPPCGRPFVDMMHYGKWLTGFCAYCEHGPECHPEGKSGG